jgi:hypothetical protein
VIEQDRARPAGAEQAPVRDVDQVPVRGRHRLAAEIASLLGDVLSFRRRRSREAAQP